METRSHWTARPLGKESGTSAPAQREAPTHDGASRPTLGDTPALRQRPGPSGWPRRAPGVGGCTGRSPRRPLRQPGKEVPERGRKRRPCCAAPSRSLWAGGTQGSARERGGGAGRQSPSRGWFAPRVLRSLPSSRTCARRRANARVFPSRLTPPESEALQCCEHFPTQARPAAARLSPRFCPPFPVSTQSGNQSRDRTTTCHKLDAWPKACRTWGPPRPAPRAPRRGSGPDRRSGGRQRQG